jgi:hypothetical protein
MSGEQERGTTDPTGKRALFSQAVTAAPVGRANGKAALFSTPPRRPGTVVIECAHCGVRSRETLLGLGFRLATGSLWMPLRSKPHWLRCPSCGRRSWCRIGWTE